MAAAAYSTLAECFVNGGYKFTKVESPFKLRGVIYPDIKTYVNTILFSGGTYNFICILYVKDGTTYGSAYLDNTVMNKQTILKEEETYAEEDIHWNNPLIQYEISLENKQYCIELIDFMKDDIIKVLINWIQNLQSCDLPRLPGTNCTGVESIMKLITAFLKNINHTGHLYLDDQSSIFSIPTIIPRLLVGKNSIYLPFGFKERNPAHIKSLVDKLRNISFHEKPLVEYIKEYVDPQGRYGQSFYPKYMEMLKTPEISASIGEIRTEYQSMECTNIYEHVSLDCQPKPQTGGTDPYYHKYIKYKQKYLKLKNQVQ